MRISSSNKFAVHIVDLYSSYGLIGAIIAEDTGFRQRIRAITYPSNMSSKMAILVAIGKTLIREGTLDYTIESLDLAYEIANEKRQIVEQSKTVYRWVYSANENRIVFGVREEGIHGKKIRAVGCIGEIFPYTRNNPSTMVNILSDPNVYVERYNKTYSSFEEAMSFRDEMISEFIEFAMGSNIPNESPVTMSEVVVG